MVDRTSLARVKDCLDQGQRFVLTTHLNPDGDGLGSEAALAAFLTDSGKDVFIFNCNPVPDNYDFLDPDNQMVLYHNRSHYESLTTADYIVILDISDWARLRQVGEDIRKTSIPRICIDHHPSSDNIADVSLVDLNACATGEIVHDLIQFCDGEFTKPIAQGLYAAIMTDTGSFKFSNTTSRALKIAGELVEAGASPDQIYQNVYERQPLSKIRLFGYILNNLHFEGNGRVCWFEIPFSVIERMGAKPYETEGFADYPRVIDDVEISIMFIELENQRTKVSLRSKGNYVVNGIAQKFGGGGHPFAAGVLLEGSLKSHVPKIIEEVTHLLKD